MFKFAIALLIICAVASSQPVPDEAAVPAIEEQKLVDQIELLEDKEEGLAVQKPTLGQVVDRLGDAVRLTIIEERDSLAKTLEQIRLAGGETLKAGLNAAQTGMQLFLVVPKFSRNVFATATNPPTQ